MDDTDIYLGTHPYRYLKSAEVLSCAASAAADGAARWVALPDLSVARAGCNAWCVSLVDH